MKKQDTFKGTVEVEIGGVKYFSTADLQPRVTKAKKPAYAVYGVKIDRNNPDLEAAVEYIGDAAGYTPAKGTDAGSWADNPIFNRIKPCLVNEGRVIGYLESDNYSVITLNGLSDNRTFKTLCKHTNGGEILKGDTMVEFGKIFYRISQDDKYNYVEVTDSAEALKDGFTDRAFSYKGKVRDKFFVGAYKGVIKDGKLRSVAGELPTGGKTIGQFRTAAQANGEGYEIMAFNKLVLLQVLFLIRFKSRNSQAALGKGLTDAAAYGNAGATDDAGLYYGNQDAKSRVKCHGIEDFWGNIWEWVDGFITTATEIKIADGNFNDKGDGYETAAQIDGDTYGIITEIYGDSKLGFIPAKADDDGEVGKEHYCNYGSVWVSGCLPVFGGGRGDGAYAGAFYFFCGCSASDAGSAVGARLLLCGGVE